MLGSEGLRLINSTTIRLFYASDHYKRFALEPYMRWYEVLGMFIISLVFMVVNKSTNHLMVSDNRHSFTSTVKQESDF